MFSVTFQDVEWIDAEPADIEDDDGQMSDASSSTTLELGM